MKTLPEEVLSTVADECLLRDLEKGEVLFEDREEGSSMFITLSGKLVVWKNDLEIARHVAAGYLGEMALIESKPRSQKL
ncbi:cyclic nucleotide-binding domain-containing protein [Nitrospinaceae bacterium]|nr:cyclic nucleotide-binding domain-containing protein [Nitrospinaceae bacterium]